MAKPSGSHSASPKGTNGKADPKASGMTTADTDGNFAGSAGSPDASGVTAVSSA